MAEKAGKRQAVGPYAIQAQGGASPQYGLYQGSAGGLGGLRGRPSPAGRYVEVERLTDPIKISPRYPFHWRTSWRPRSRWSTRAPLRRPHRDLAEPGGRHEDDEDDEQGRGQDEQPAEVADRSPEAHSGPSQTVRRGQSPTRRRRWSRPRRRRRPPCPFPHRRRGAGDQSPQAVEAGGAGAVSRLPKGGLEGRRRSRHALEGTSPVCSVCGPSSCWVNVGGFKSSSLIKLPHRQYDASTACGHYESIKIGRGAT